MNWVSDFFISNFVLICISIIMYVIAIQRFKQHTKISVYTICLVSSALILAIADSIQDYARIAVLNNLAIFCGILGYTIRPLCIYFMILMSEKIIPKKYFWLTYLPLIFNAIVYLCAFIPGTADIIFGFKLAESDGQLHFAGGPLRYSSHIISILYLSLLLFVAFANLKAKHLNHGLIILICSMFVVTAVVIETFFNPDGDIRVLNTTIAVSTLFYYLYLYMEITQIDALTGLFNRETYYHDILKMHDSATGIIQFDMNGLKYINDNFGHLEGDKALSTIASLIIKCAKRNMYAYRLGGDEFLVIVNGGSQEDIDEVVVDFKDALSKTKYYCSIGCAYREDNSITLEDLLRDAEKAMYHDKAEFYKNANFERRNALK